MFLGAGCIQPARAETQAQLDSIIESELDTAMRDPVFPIAKLAASALAKATPSPDLDEIDKKILDFPPQDLTDVTDITSERFEGQKRIQKAMKDAYVAHGGGKRGEFAASQAGGMQAVSEAMKQEGMRKEKGRKRQGLIRFRFDYKQGAWPLAIEQNAQDPADQILMARAIRRSMERNPASISDEKRDDSVLAYTAALVGTAFLPFGKRQLLQIFDESQGWYDGNLRKVGNPKKKAKIAERNVAGCLAFLHANIDALNAAEAENIAKRLVDSAVLAEDAGLYSDAIYALEHQGHPGVGKREAAMGAEEAFLIAGLYQEARGDKTQALDVYQAYLQDYAGYNLKYKARAKFSELMTQKAAALSKAVGANAKPHVNRKWGVRSEDIETTAKEHETDRKRKDSGLEWD